MRMATCVADIQLSVLGSKESVQIAKGSEVDFDRVIGESAGVPVTLEQALGPHVQHFDSQPPIAPARRSRHVPEAPAAPSEES